MPIVDYKEILRATNGGLDIIAAYYPEAPHAIHKNPPKFKIRKEKTASASIRKKPNADMGEEIWYVTDFGSDQKERHAINICMLEDNLSFKDACSKLGYQYGITGTNPVANVVKPKMDVRDIKAEETDASDKFQYKNKPDAELLKRVFGPLVEPEHLTFCNLKEVDHYTLFRKGKAITISSTADCPIYAFDEGEWRKIYQPWNTDKGFKFSYSGTKPKRFVFGLDELEKEFKRRETARNNKIEAGRMSDKEMNEEWRPDAFIMSGGSDAINMKSTGRFPIWFNSESELLAPQEYKRLKKWCGNIYYVADMDKTGRRQAIATGMKYLDIKLVFLPKELLGYRSSNGKPLKDFKDFIRLKCKPEKEDAFEYLLNSIIRSAMPMQFWYYQKGKYSIAHSQSFQFLALNGIGKIEDNNLKEGFRFIHVDGNVVREVDPVKIENKLLSFLEERRQPIQLRDLFIRSGQLSPKQLNKLPYVTLDFQTTGPDHQYFFFKNKVVKVLANKLELSNHGDGDIYAWEEKVMDFGFKELDPFFKITKDVNDDLQIKVTEKNCMFLNFLINTSRVHWKTELEERWDDPDSASAKAYFEQHHYDISGPKLQPDEIQEQQLHLINKIYALGYLFHEHKMMNRAYAIYAMDHKISDIGESNGGSGKSLCFGQQYRFLNRKYIPSRNKKSVEENQFVYDGVSEKTDYVLFDDAHRYFSIDFFFSEITGAMLVNPKHGTPFEVPFAKSPKFVVSSNHAPSLDRSAERRLLFTVFSDYYHYMKDEDDEYRQHRTVANDFDEKQMFSDWDDAEYNRYMNFIIQCVQFYLRHPDKVNPPMGNVSKRNLIHEMGDKFLAWADEFFYEEPGQPNTWLNDFVQKSELFDKFLEQQNIQKGRYKLTTFKKNIKHYCKYNNWVFNPVDLITDKNNGRIMRTVDGSNQEFFFIDTKKSEEGTAIPMTAQQAVEDMLNDKQS